MHTFAERKLLMLKPEEIVNSEISSRNGGDEYKIKRLADSIMSSGILEPLAVRKTADGRFELIAGGRRLKAAKIAGLRRIPCIIHTADDSTALLYSIIENTKRCDLDYFTEAELINTLITRYGMSQTEVAMRIGLSQSELLSKLKLLSIEKPLRQKITENNLTQGQVFAILRIEAEKREQILKTVIDNHLNTYQTKALVENIIFPFEKEETVKEEIKPVRKSAIGDERLFSNSLYKLINSLINAGVDVKTRKSETEKFVEYKIRINKLAGKETFEQLKIC